MSINQTPNSNQSCKGCSTLVADVQGALASTSYSVNSIAYNPFSYSGGTPALLNQDDTWSSVINLPFCFQYFENAYTDVVIGANGELTFNLNMATCGNAWAITSALPFLGGNNCPSLPSFSNAPGNTICAVFRDIDPGLGGNIGYYTTGTSPCRAFVVYWADIPLYNSFGNISNSTFQLVLYESTNYIDVYIENSYSFQNWNEGYGIVGIQNQAATVAFCAPNRNYPTTWTANNEAWRFTPSGPPNKYSLTWYGPPNIPIGIGQEVSVCPTVATTYTVTLVDISCGNSVTDIATILPLDPPCEAIYIPNAFSPNNDLENDMECVLGSCIEQFHLIIYDRWGEKIFESFDQAVCWDGTYKGNPLDPAIFNYYLAATVDCSEKIKKKGNISLIR